MATLSYEIVFLVMLVLVILILLYHSLHKYYDTTYRLCDFIVTLKSVCLKDFMATSKSLTIVFLEPLVLVVSILEYQSLYICYGIANILYYFMVTYMFYNKVI